MKRILVLTSGIILDSAGTYDEAHAKIIARARRAQVHINYYETVDTWTEPGRVVDNDGHLFSTWESA